MFMLVSTVYAYPSLPTEFYGQIYDHNLNASGGTVTTYINNTLCGSFTIINSGFYGVLSCLAKDTDNYNSSGGVDGDNVTFEYKGAPVTIIGNNSFASGEFKSVIIRYPEVVCQDTFCDALENCSSCPLDCGQCAGGGSGSGGGGGSGGAGGGGGSGSSGGGGGSAGGGGVVNGGCTENWACKDWSNCSILGIHSRNCTDVASCGSYTNKPKEVEECLYEGNCFDNLINCHEGVCEEGVDCNGPCEKKCAEQQQPLGNITINLPKIEFPKKVCEKHVDYRDPALLIFIFIILIAIIIRYVYTNHIITKWRKDEKITPLQRARKIKSAKRKNLLFVITLFFLTIVSFLYSYFFLLCPTDFIKYSWLLIILLILIPLVVNTVMKKFEYSAVEHLDKTKRLDDIHYQSILNMIELENNILADEENVIANKLYELSKKKEFREIIESNHTLKEVYKNLIKLYTDYKDKKNPFNIEKDFCDEINTLDLDEQFKKDISTHPELKHLFDRLKKLYAQYEEKQKLYDKLDQIEQGNKNEK